MTRQLLLATMLLALCCSSSAHSFAAADDANSSEIAITLVRSEESGAMVLRAEPVDRASIEAFVAAGGKLGDLLQLSILDPTAKTALPKLAASVVKSPTGLELRPAFPLRSGQAFQATLRLESLGGIRPMSVVVATPSVKLPAPVSVTAVYPPGDKLPENQLKFYVYFSGSMGRGDAYKHVRLLDAEGNTIVEPFLEIGEEFWDQSQQRLTLLIDPGRIKQGVAPREIIGPVFEMGKKYKLVIDSTWPDAHGRHLTKGFEKSFEIVAPIRSAIDHTKWKVKLPRAGSNEHLVVEFDRPMDHALLERTISLHDATGKRLEACTFTANNDQAWTHIGGPPWPAGKYQLRIDTVLEDLAGNRIGKAFEIDELRPLDRVIDQSDVTIDFEIKPVEK